jgi:hypothetical protein
LSGSISTPVIEVSKIQLRRGLSNDLPGAPTIGNPSLPTTPLDVGELAFTTDTGQVFIGPELQNNGGSTFNRSFFPYQNIEVLTENSRTFLNSLFDYYYRDVQTGFYATTPLNNTTNTNTWQTVLVNAASGEVPCIVSATSNLACAQLTYYLYDTNTTVRTGKISIVYIGGSQQPILEDDYTVYPRTDLSTQNAMNPDMLYGSLQFRAVPISNGSGQNVVLEYQNLGATTPIMFFKIDRGAAFQGNTITNSNSESSNNSGNVILTFQIGNTPVLVDTWGTSTVTGGVCQYFVIATTNSGTGTGSQVSQLVVGTDGVSGNFTDDAMYFSPGSMAPNVLNYQVSVTSGVVSVLANTIETGAVATVTLIKFPLYLVQS